MHIKRMVAALLLLCTVGAVLVSCGEKTPAALFAKEVWDNPIEETKENTEVDSGDPAYYKYTYRLRADQMSKTSDILQLTCGVSERALCEDDDCESHSVKETVSLTWYYESGKERYNTLRGTISYESRKCITGGTEQVKYAYAFDILDLSLLKNGSEEADASALSEKIKLYSMEDGIWYDTEHMISDATALVPQMYEILKRAAEGMDYIYGTAVKRGYDLKSAE